MKAALRLSPTDTLRERSGVREQAVDFDEIYPFFIHTVLVSSMSNEQIPIT
jgi:hypothetical protein